MACTRTNEQKNRSLAPPNERKSSKIVRKGVKTGSKGQKRSKLGGSSMILCVPPTVEMRQVGVYSVPPTIEMTPKLILRYSEDTKKWRSDAPNSVFP